MTELSDDVTKGLVDSISIDSVDAESNRWYYKPQLRDDIYKKILKDGSVDSFKLISDRLLSILKSATIIQYTIKGRFMSR